MPAKALPKSRPKRVKRALKPKIYIETNYTPHLDLWSSAPAAVIPRRSVSRAALPPRRPAARPVHMWHRAYPLEGVNARADAAIRLLVTMESFYRNAQSRANVNAAFRAYFTARAHHQNAEAVRNLTALADTVMQNFVTLSELTPVEIETLTQLRTAGNTAGFADYVTHIINGTQPASGSSSAGSGSNGSGNSNSSDRPDFEDPLVLWNFLMTHDPDFVRRMEILERRERGSGSSSDSGPGGSRIRVGAQSPCVSTPQNSLESLVQASQSTSAVTVQPRVGPTSKNRSRALGTPVRQGSDEDEVSTRLRRSVRSTRAPEKYDPDNGT